MLNTGAKLIGMVVEYFFVTSCGFIGLEVGNIFKDCSWRIL